MIKYDYTVTVTGNTAKLDKDIYLFRGNKNVHYYFAIKNASFNFKGSTDLIEKTNAINAAVTVIKPNNVEVASAIAKVENGKIHLKVTEDLIDEEVEVGDFDLVFDLFDDTDGAVTIPKVIGQFHVLERPCTTPISELVATNTTNEVDQALTDYAIVTYAEPVASTNADGTFAKKTWVAKEKITTAELNRMEEGISDVSSQCKDIANKTIIEDGKLYLAKSDGTKIDSGTTLPTGGNSAYGGTYTTLEAINTDNNADITKYYILTSGDNAGYAVVYDETTSSWILGWNMGGNSNNNTDDGTYDTEISLPYTANSDTDVELTFSVGNSVSYTNLCPNGNDISQYQITASGTPQTTAEIVNDEEKGYCLHYKNAITGGYNTLRLLSSNTWDSTHYYYVSYWVKMVTHSTNYPEYPIFSVGTNTIAGSESFNYDDTTSWQRVSFITQPASYLTSGIGINISADGEFYFKPIIVLDMDGLGYDLSTVDTIRQNGATYITDLDTKVLQTNNGFSCVVNNGGNTENIEVFSTGNKVYYYTVANGNTLSINKREGYNMPTVTAKVKGNSNITQDIEDVDIKITTRFAGKKVVFEGDSITDSDYHEAYNGKSWADYLANKLKMTIASNMALGGSSISTYNSAGSVVNRITTNNYPSDTKLFCIMAGTNDWNSNVALGEIDSTDTSTILGALNTIIDHLQTNYPDATIVIMTPMHRSGMRTATRTAGTLSDVAKAYEEVCMNWGVNCVNTLKEFGINAYNTTVANKFYVEQDSNWLHPNPEGHKRIAIRMAGYISTL